MTGKNASARIAAVSFLIFALLISFSSAEEYRFDLAEFEKKPYHLGGYAEYLPKLLGLDRDSRPYKQRFFDREEGATLVQHDLTLQLDGSYEKGITRFFARTNSNLSDDGTGWSGKTDLFEGYLSAKPSPSLVFDFGKKTLNWGKGYAWNPVAFLDRPKDPDDPGLNREGFWVAGVDYIKSFDGPLKTFSFSPVLLPVYGDMNEDFGEAGHLNFAARLYFLLFDTDIDFLFQAGGSRSNRYGFDFSRNIASNFEVHGELAWIRKFRKSFVDETGMLFETESDVLSSLIGIRYLSPRETTYILEYYQNGTGFTESETAAYYAFIDRGHDVFIRTGNEALLRQAARVTEGRYGRPNPMERYLYLRVSQKEPLDILYFTPSLTLIGNIDDRSFSLSPELLYTGITNFEMRLKGVWLQGKSMTEFGEKPNDYRLELRLRYYF